MQENISLYKKDERSDKEYHLDLVEVEGGLWSVNYRNGKRGGTLQSGKKTPAPVSYAEAKKKYDAVVKEKTRDGYVQGEGGTAYIGGDLEERVTGVLPMLLNAIGEDEAEKYLRDPDWVLQEKEDGHRRLIKKTADSLVGVNRKGLATGLPQTVVDAVNLLVDKHRITSMVLDGELMGDVFALFDVLEMEGRDIRQDLLEGRLLLLQELGSTLAAHKCPGMYVLETAHGEAQKRALFAKLKARKAEGAVFKHIESTYTAGRPSSGGSALKLKFTKDATVIVEKLHATKRSIHMALLDDKGELVSVGKCTIPVNQDIPAVGDLVDVNYLYAFVGGSLFQPVYKGKRDDIERAACTLAQLHYKAASEEDSDEA